MALSLNESALALADRLAAEAESVGVAVTTLSNGARLIDCGAKAPGGFEAGRVFAEICMAGLGSVAYAPVVFDGRWFPGVTVTTDRPAVACLAWAMSFSSAPKSFQPTGPEQAGRCWNGEAK